ncbi:MAG: bacillithiol biosynthesis deacetylase BshB1 [Acidobacteria bacterium]|nr:bacillithiol biosynthesis deacetylase BshB1 [Acidobacteriota bacterium]
MEPIDILAIGAHPDDAEIGAGGTLLRCGALGYRTAILDMTRGELGTRGTAEERAAESADAAAVLGLAWRGTLDLGDGHIRDTTDSRRALVRAYRELRPRIVLTHSWEEAHPDHIATAQLARDCVYLAGLAKYEPEDGLERFRPSCVAHFNLPRWTPPSFIVDVSEWYELKERAIACHRSQLHDPERNEPQTALSSSDFAGRLRHRSHHYGTLIGAEHGEPFLVREAIAADDPVRILDRPMNLFY